MGDIGFFTSSVFMSEKTSLTNGKVICDSIRYFNKNHNVKSSQSFNLISTIGRKLKILMTHGTKILRGVAQIFHYKYDLLNFHCIKFAAASIIYPK